MECEFELRLAPRLAIIFRLLDCHDYDCDNMTCFLAREFCSLGIKSVNTLTLARFRAGKDAFVSILFDQIFNFDNLKNAYEKSLKADGKYKKEALVFQRNETVNLLKLQKELYSGTYKFQGYTTFEVFEPKKRIVNAPHYRDKIVQLALNDVLKHIFMRKFIKTSYACMDDRGTHKAVEKVQHNLKQAHWLYGDDATIAKVDVSKFFYSIDREITKKLYRKVIKEEDVLLVLDTIINSGMLVSEVGLPLGNTLSQLCANIYLNALDQYCMRYLGYKYYVRYADDIVIVLPDKDAATEAKDKCIAFLREKLNLLENPKKTQTFPISQGVNCFGFKIYRTHRLLRDESKKKIKRKIKKMPRLIANGLMTVETANQMLGSWSGHAKYGSTQNFIKSILERRTYIKWDGKKLAINEEELKCYITKMVNTN